VMIPHAAEWRYGSEGPAMPWYNSVHLIRQGRQGDWMPVLDAVAAELDRRAAGAGR